jgi:hypothetical protein
MNAVRVAPSLCYFDLQKDWVAKGRKRRKLLTGRNGDTVNLYCYRVESCLKWEDIYGQGQ